MKKCCLVFLCLAALLTAGVAPVLAADNAPTAPVWAAVECAQTPAATGSQTAVADLFVPKPSPADAPICNPFCVTSQCSKSSECTAQPNGHCALACPSLGCCVY